MAPDPRRTYARDVLCRTFGIDLRSLALLRVALALLLLADLALRLPFLSAHLSDSGILPREAVQTFTPYAWAGSPVWAGSLFVVAAACALCLLAGWHTRVATIASWTLLVSLHLRNPYLNDAGDKLLALLLFWGMFLPLGAYASLDARAGRAPRFERPQVCSPASLALLLQVAFVYVFTALLKHPRLWLVEGTAVYYSLHVDLVATDIGRALLSHPSLLKALSRATWLLEFFGPFLAFVPVGTAAFRLAVVAAFVGLHVGLALCFHLALLSAVCIAAWTAFLPGEMWDALARTRFARRLVSLTSALPARTPARERAVPAARAPALDLLIVLLLLYVFWWNAGAIVSALQMPPSLQRAGEQLSLRQRWSMFASPLRADGWWVVPAVLRDGREADLFTGRSPVRWEKPEDVAATFRS
ncbi:MAG TPA: HTTM domain-containing protein, partial [Planctomycetota bacterium]|nr:HTTM domain-containing protein [Planctomycetota bacterium]